MQRNLEYKKDLLGTVPFGRFSYAMTSVGDINYDGWDGMFVCCLYTVEPVCKYGLFGTVQVSWIFRVSFNTNRLRTLGPQQSVWIVQVSTSTGSTAYVIIGLHNFL